ncbi:MAG: hypothetical protein P1P76_12525, partial [Anaerolineales bacterium]|nr:hypothetical protein [Anaerolineales bacterium]
LLVLVLASALVLGYFFLANRIRETFTFLPVVLVATVFPLGISALVLFLAWFSFTRMHPRSAAFVIYFLVGLLFQVFLILSLRSFPLGLRGTFIDSFRMVVFSHGLISNFLILSSSFTILGLVGLIRRNPGEADSNNQSPKGAF